MRPIDQAIATGHLKQKLRWPSFFLIFLTTLVTLTCVPIYIFHVGVSKAEWALFFFYVFATSFSITAGYHRLFAHSTFKANALVRFLVLFFGAGAFQQSAFKWSSQHRTHHQYVDTELDPHNIRYGFFYAHMGWILFWKQPANEDNVKDLGKSRLIMHQHRYYPLWAVTAGLITPILIGGFMGHWMGGLLLAVALRLVLVLNSTFFINSFAHTFGTANYDPHSSAKDNWFGAVLTNGEGYHNYHHRFPNDYRNGIHWYDWDPTKWIIWTLGKIGWAQDLRQTSNSMILAAKQETALAKSSRI